MLLDAYWGQQQKEANSSPLAVAPREGCTQRSRSHGCLLSRLSCSWLYTQAFSPPAAMLLCIQPRVQHLTCAILSQSSHTHFNCGMLTVTGQISGLSFVLCAFASRNLFKCEACILHITTCPGFMRQGLGCRGLQGWPL